MRRLLTSEFRPYRKSLALTAALSALTAAVEVAVVYLIAILGTAILSGSDRAIALPAGFEVSRKQLSYVAIAAVLFRGALQLLLVQLQQRTLANYEKRSRIGFLSDFLDTEWSTQAALESGDFFNTVGNFLNQTRSALQRIVDGATSSISFAIVLVGSFAVGGWWVLAILGGTLALAVVFRPLVHSSHSAGEAARLASRRFSRALVETIFLASEARIFAASDAMKDRDSRASVDLAEANRQAGLASSRLSSLYSTATYTIAAIGLVIVVLFDLTNPAPFVTVVLLVYRGIGYGQGVQSAYQSLVGSVPAIEGLQAMRSEFQSTALPEGGVEFVPPIESIRFASVGFSYDGKAQALQAIELELRRGDALGVVGPSGAGKSTLVQLLLRLRLPTSGTVLINDIDLASIRPKSWFGHVVLVPQDAGLLNASVIDNVLWFRGDLTRDDAIEAMRAAHILDEMLALPDGVDTSVGEKGGRLSGGQRQRLCIARALAGSPDVLVLDEPTSALDLISEEAIRTTLESLRGQVTLVVIAHRLSTLRICDRVMVLKDGRMEAMGGRSQLEQGNQFYAEVQRLSRLV